MLWSVALHCCPVQLACLDSDLFFIKGVAKRSDLARQSEEFLFYDFWKSVDNVQNVAQNETLTHTLLDSYLNTLSASVSYREEV